MYITQVLSPFHFVNNTLTIKEENDPNEPDPAFANNRFNTGHTDHSPVDQLFKDPNNVRTRFRI